MAKSLATVRGIGLNAREIETKLRGSGSFAWIARQLPLEVTAEARKLKLPGIYFLEAHRRSYPRAMLASNVIGYVGLDGDGLGGIEHSFDDQVSGTPRQGHAAARCAARRCISSAATAPTARATAITSS